MICFIREVILGSTDREKGARVLLRGVKMKCFSSEVPAIKLSFTLGTLSKDVFEARTSTGSEAFSLFICLDANKLVLLSFFSLLKTIYPRVSTKSFPSDAKSPLPVDVRRSKTLLLKLPIMPTSCAHVIHYSLMGASFYYTCCFSGPVYMYPANPAYESATF